MPNEQMLRRRLQLRLSGKQRFYERVAKHSGLKRRDFEKLEQFMMLEDKNNRITQFLRAAKLPKSQELVRRLLCQPGLRWQHKRGVAKLNYAAKSQNQEIVLRCRLILGQRTTGFGRKVPVIRVQVFCRVIQRGIAGGHCLFRQEIALSPGRGCRLRKREGSFELRSQPPQQFIPLPHGQGAVLVAAPAS